MGRWENLRGDGGGKTMIKMYLVKIFTLNKKTTNLKYKRNRVEKDKVYGEP